MLEPAVKFTGKKEETTVMVTPDTQNEPDDRGVALQEVGIKGFSMPLTLKGWQRDEHATQVVRANIDASVSLNPELKGIHMSRITEWLSRQQNPVCLSDLGGLIDEIRRKQQARSGRIRVEFRYFIERTAPVSGISGPLGLDTIYEASLVENRLQLRQSVTAPVKTLCPCSKAISDYGAHNQRGYVTVELLHEGIAGELPDVSICPEELVQMIDQSGSSPIYPILKRVDERHVTMKAYENPAFVEDVARNMVVQLRNDRRFQGFKVTVINQESIHDHDAYAMVQG